MLPQVQAVRYVTATELQDLLLGATTPLKSKKTSKDETAATLLWSPWFRLIAQHWLLPRWWPDLDRALCSENNPHRDWSNVHRFDPPAEHLGRAGPWLGSLGEKTSSGLEASLVCVGCSWC